MATASSHDRGHRHDHDHHAHAGSRDADRRYLAIALGLLLAFMAIEVVFGILASSLALISDAGHMLADAGAIGLALFAIRLSARPAGGPFTYGLKRAEILSAQANGITLLLLAAWFVFEAIGRLLHPPAVEGSLVTLIAIVGIGVNLAAVWVMSKANRQSLNIEGSFQHILTDLYAFIATAIAGALIWWFGWNRLDAIAALLVSALMFVAGYKLVRESGRVFMEAAPRGLEPQAICDAISVIPAISRIEDLHVWEVTSGMPALSAHIFVSVDVDCHDKRREIEAMLHDRFRLSHTTLQMDHGKADPQSQQVCRLDI
ncbi:MAG: cation diffusion facilitator family transporter [Rhodanobacteraceae bacterium]